MIIFSHPGDVRVIEAEKEACQNGSRDGFWVPGLERWVSKERHYFPSQELEQPVLEYLAEQYRRAQGHHQVDHKDELLACRMGHDFIRCLHDSSQFEVAAEVAADSDADADADAVLHKKIVKFEVKEIWVSFFLCVFVISSYVLIYLQPLNCQILYTIKMLPLNSVVTARLRQMRRLLLL